MKQRPYLKWKRLADLVVGLVLLFLLSWLILVCIILAMVDTRAFGVFVQLRIGQYGRPFYIYKIRTINPRTGRSGRFSQFLRNSKLDELPQLFNVLKGDMSFVGPRPLLPEYLPLYSKRQRRRHEVKPGITGWAQVNGRNAISWEQKFE